MPKDPSTPGARERNLFRASVALAGLVPVGAGLGGAIYGSDFVETIAQAPDASLDSHVRYLSGLLLAVGLAFWTTLAKPEAHAGRYRLLTAIVVAGGLARLGGAVLSGEPNLAMRLALVMELGVTPLICLWQHRLARRARPQGPAQAPAARLPADAPVKAQPRTPAAAAAPVSPSPRDKPRKARKPGRSASPEGG